MEQEDFYERTLAILEKHLHVMEEMRDLMEKMANREGALGKRNLKNVRDYLEKHKTITKQGIRRLLNVVNHSALEIMKRLDREKDIRYIPGHGARQSCLVLVEEGSITDKAIQLAGMIPRASCLSRDEIIQKLDCDKNDITPITNTVEQLFPNGEFFWQTGQFIHARN